MYMKLHTHSLSLQKEMKINDAVLCCMLQHTQYMRSSVLKYKKGVSKS